MNLLECDSFRQLMVQRVIRPRTYKSNIEAMEAVSLLATICQLGDQILRLARNERISARRAEALILDLSTCFAAPLERARRVSEIEKEMRDYVE